MLYLSTKKENVTLTDLFAKKYGIIKAVFFNDAFINEYGKKPTLNATLANKYKDGKCQFEGCICLKI